MRVRELTCGLLNRLTAANSQNLFVKFFEYDALSRLTRQFGGPPTTFTYDDASQLRTLHTLLAGVIDEQFDYAYDRVGNRQSLTDHFGLHTYAYDTLNRLTSAAHPLASGLITEAFTYDPVGNRRTSHLSLAHTYDAANRLLADDAFTYTYDANGNLTSKTDKGTGALTTYTYDVENQLVTLHSPLVTASYRYDGLGRRIEKDVAGTLTRYLYDQEDIWLILNGTTNCATHAVLHGPGIDQPLAFVKDTNADCTFTDAAGFREPVVYLQQDGLGSPTSLISETGGFFRSLFLAERYTYDSFGTPRITGPGPDQLMDTGDDVILSASALGNPYLFTGREYDAESGLYYHRHRYRDPRTGRWLQEDPIGLFGGVNFYAFVSNNPVIFSDPFGLGPIKDKIAEQLQEKFGRHLSQETIDKASTEFEKEAERTGRTGEMIGVSINPFLSKKKKEQVLGKAAEEILSGFKERAKNDPELKSLQEALERANREHELDREHCPLGGSRNAQ